MALIRPSGRERPPINRNAPDVPLPLPPRTGVLPLDDGGSIGPALTRAAFLASPLAGGAHDLVVTERWHSWQVTCGIGGEAFGVGLYFAGETLRMLQMMRLSSHDLARPLLPIGQPIMLLAHLK